MSRRLSRLTRSTKEAAGEKKPEAWPLATSRVDSSPERSREPFSAACYGSMVMSTNAGTPSAPFLSVTRSLKRKVRVSDT